MEHPAGEPRPPVFIADRLGITTAVILLAVAGVSWGATWYSTPLMMAPMDSGIIGVAAIVSSLEPAAVALFLVIWVVGMTAMMFPAMIPVVLFYNKVATKAEPNPALASAVGTPLFLAGYLLMYAGLGLSAYVGVFLAIQASASSQILASIGFLAPGLILIGAGVYQISPLKQASLSHCVSPITFFSVHSQRGLMGSLRMGISHGKYCVGCCWAYMLVMLGVAAMSLPAMAILAAVITLEKVIVRGARWFTFAVAGGFVLFGAASLAFPGILGL